MEKREISKVDVISAGKVVGAIFGTVGIIYGVLGSFFQIISLFSYFRASLLFLAIATLVIAPLACAIFGFIYGLIISLIYNFAAGRFGGLKYEVKTAETESATFSASAAAV